MSLAHALKKLGFTDKKIAVYLSLLENGESTARDIVSRTNLRRTTVYDVLGELAKAGLISEAVGGKEKKTFLAEDPVRIESLIEEKAKHFALQKQKLDQQQSELKSLVPQLKSLSETAAGKPKIHFYEGAKGLVDALNDCLIKKQPLYMYGSLNLWRRWMSDHFEWYEAELAKRKIDVKRIEQKSIDKLRGMDPDETATDWPVKFLPVGFNINGFTVVYGEKVLMASFQRPMATVIEDKDYAATQRAVFEVFWQFLREG